MTGIEYTTVYAYNKIKKLIEDIRNKKFTHARYRPGFGVATIYHRDFNSPSGVMRVNGAHDTLVTEICRRYNKAAPISSTEQI